MARRRYDPIPDLTLATLLLVVGIILVGIGEGWIK